MGYLMIRACTPATVTTLTGRHNHAALSEDLSLRATHAVGKACAAHVAAVVQGADGSAQTASPTQRPHQRIRCPAAQVHIAVASKED